jgi:NAD-dependent dihydropyrimidine dehydrogenase PreA subunit
MVAKVNVDECVGCGACADVCPQEAIAVDDVAVVNEAECVDCGACADECPNNAVTVVKK